MDQTWIGWSYFSLYLPHEYVKRWWWWWFWWWMMMMKMNFNIFNTFCVQKQTIRISLSDIKCYYFQRRKKKVSTMTRRMLPTECITIQTWYSVHTVSLLHYGPWIDHQFGHDKYIYVFNAKTAYISGSFFSFITEINVKIKLSQSYFTDVLYSTGELGLESRLNLRFSKNVFHIFALKC